MSKLNLLAIILVLNLISCDNSNSAKKGSETDPIITSLQKHADSLLLDSKITAVSIGIYKDGKEYIGHYGDLDKGQNNKPSDNTLYEIASVSKTFTGTVISQAELDGKLSLDDDIRDYLDEDYPNLAFQDQPIRIRHLISHSSRLPKFLPDTLNALFSDIDESLPFKIYDIEKNYNREKFFADLHTVQLDTVPGSRYDYSNIDTEIIAHILEKIYEKNYDQILKEYVFDVANMPNTKINLSEAESKNLANGYGETNKVVPHLVNPLWGAGGGVKSTIPDLINYMKFQLDKNNKVVQNSRKVIYEDDDSTIGYYWPIKTDEEDGTYYGHHGGSLGTQNFLFIMPKHNLGLSIITNQSDQETAGKLMGATINILDDLR